MDQESWTRMSLRDGLGFQFRPPAKWLSPSASLSLSLAASLLPLGKKKTEKSSICFVGLFWKVKWNHVWVEGCKCLPGVNSVTYGEGLLLLLLRQKKGVIASPLLLRKIEWVLLWQYIRDLVLSHTIECEYRIQPWEWESRWRRCGNLGGWRMGWDSGENNQGVLMPEMASWGVACGGRDSAGWRHRGKDHRKGHDRSSRY